MDKIVRKPAVAGSFYPQKRETLLNVISELMEKTNTKKSFENIYGVIAPHAGYIYSGYTAAYAYNALRNKKFDTAIIISPSHREYFHGVSIYDGDYFSTPLGNIPINKNIAKTIAENSASVFLGQVGHGAEHAVEVHLPFLQFVNPDLKIVPIVIGDQRKSFVYELADRIVSCYSEDLVLIASSDLSHFYPKETAAILDKKIQERILNFEYDELLTDLEKNECEACGGGPIVSVIKAASSLGYTNLEILSKTDSGDFSGDNTSVVGYLSAVIYK